MPDARLSPSQKRPVAQRLTPTLLATRVSSETPLRSVSERPRRAQRKRSVARSRAQYDGPVSGQTVSGGVVHELPTDLRQALMANATALEAWNDITALARNEFICWVEDAKQESTRARRIQRTQEELEEGQRRPCCWRGCKHRDRTGN